MNYPVGETGGTKLKGYANANVKGKKQSGISINTKQRNAAANQAANKYASAGTYASAGYASASRTAATRNIAANAKPTVGAGVNANKGRRTSAPQTSAANIKNISGAAHGGRNIPAGGTTLAGGRTSARVKKSIYSERMLTGNAQRMIARGGIPTHAGKDYNTRKKRAGVKGKDLTTPLKRRIAEGTLRLNHVIAHLMGLKSGAYAKTVTKRKPAAKAIPFGMIITITVCAVLAMFWVMPFMEVHENAIYISEAKARIVDAQKAQKELEIQLENRIDLAYFESEAVNRLGMIKKEFLPQKYVSMRNEEKIEIIKKDAENSNSPFETALNAISSVFSNVLPN